MGFEWLTQSTPEPAPQAGFGWIDDPATLESPGTIDEPLMHRRKARRRRTLAAIRQEKLEAFFTELPERGESIHIVSNGSFDYWNFVPVCLRLLGKPAREFYGSTWTMSRPNALQLLQLFDEGRLRKVTLFSGLYFKRRESAVYATIASGLIDRQQRFLCFENHSKIILLAAGAARIVIEGSANFTANPRVEQNTVTNDADLYNFHRSWMEEQLAKCRKKNKQLNL
jgi:hypothetical protein